MDMLTPSAPILEHYPAECFFRHHRRLRTIRHDGQAWFCLPDLARLMGVRLDERCTIKLDPDQRRTAWLECHGLWEKCLMVSESGVFALLIHHYVPENRALRQWLTHEVLPELHKRTQRMVEEPDMSRLQWLGNTLLMLQWKNESWVRWRDMPCLMAEVPRGRGVWQRIWDRALGRRSAVLRDGDFR